jgi:hypothetical protein
MFFDVTGYTNFLSIIVVFWIRWESGKGRCKNDRREISLVIRMEVEKTGCPCIMGDDNRTFYRCILPVMLRSILPGNYLDCACWF